MFARLLPQGNGLLVAHELARMGHQAPEEFLAQRTLLTTYKLMDVPCAAAATLTAWWQAHLPEAWWYSTAGAESHTVDLLLGGPVGCLEALRQSATQVPALQDAVAALTQATAWQESGPTTLLLGQTAFDLRRRALVMGILNVTPDSFSDGGLYLQPEQAIKHAEAMIEAGADLIDVGGQSSRPGAVPVPATVEQARVVPVVEEIVKRYGALVSVDTYRASVAAAALDVGAVLINDISALRFDAQMAPLVARRGASVVLMHMQGTPQTMQRSPTYRHVLDEVYGFLAARLQLAMQYGIPRQRIVLDPGFGFGKTVPHNLDLLRGLAPLQGLGQPLLVGTSRKSFLGRLLQRKVWDRLEGTLVTVIYAVLQGAAMVRVHDVEAVVQAVRLLEALEKPSWPGLETF